MQNNDKNKTELLGIYWK